MSVVKSNWKQQMKLVCDGNILRNEMESESKTILWKAMMKGFVDKCIMNEKYDEGKKMKWILVWRK